MAPLELATATDCEKQTATTRHNSNTQPLRQTVWKYGLCTFAELLCHEKSQVPRYQSQPFGRCHSVLAGQAFEIWQYAGFEFKELWPSKRCGTAQRSHGRKRHPAVAQTEACQCIWQFPRVFVQRKAKQDLWRVLFYERKTEVYKAIRKFWRTK